MRLYLSSFRIGNTPDALLRLLDGGRRTALIANSCDALTANDRVESTQQEIDRLAAVGLEPYEVDLRDYFNAGPAAVTAEISGFDLVWLRGGNTFVLRRSLHQSGADLALLTMLRNDAIVYGGYSAGVCVLAPSLRGLELVDDPNDVPPGYEAPIIWDGLDVLSYAVAPHYKSDHPESAAIETLVDYYVEQDIPFKAICDGQAIVVHGAASTLEG